MSGGNYDVTHSSSEVQHPIFQKDGIGNFFERAITWISSGGKDSFSDQDRLEYRLAKEIIGLWKTAMNKRDPEQAKLQLNRLSGLKKQHIKDKLIADELNDVNGSRIALAAKTIDKELSPNVVLKCKEALSHSSNLKVGEFLNKLIDEEEIQKEFNKNPFVEVFIRKIEKETGIMISLEDIRKFRKALKRYQNRPMTISEIVGIFRKETTFKDLTSQVFLQDKINAWNTALNRLNNTKREPPTVERNKRLITEQKECEEKDKELKILSEHKFRIDRAFIKSAKGRVRSGKPLSFEDMIRLNRAIHRHNIL